MWRTLSGRRPTRTPLHPLQEDVPDKGQERRLAHKRGEVGRCGDVPAALDASNLVADMTHHARQVTHNFTANNICRALVGRVETRKEEFEEQVRVCTP